MKVAFVFKCIYCKIPIFIKTLCLSTPTESTPETFPVQMSPTKSVPGEKGLDFLSPRCVLVI